MQQSFAGATLGEDYVSEPPFDMEATWKETSRSTPIFFVLFPGVDPTLWVEALGKVRVFRLVAQYFCPI